MLPIALTPSPSFCSLAAPATEPPSSRKPLNFGCLAHTHGGSSDCAVAPCTIGCPARAHQQASQVFTRPWVPSCYPALYDATGHTLVALIHPDPFCFKTRMVLNSSVDFKFTTKRFVWKATVTTLLWHPSKHPNPTRSGAAGTFHSPHVGH